MSDPELVYTVALAALRKAQNDYAEAETKLIQAERAVTAAKGATKYAKLLSGKMVSWS